MTKIFLPSILAGVCITIGSAAYCASPNWGLFLFCAGLITICYKQYALFTGVIGYARSAKDWVRAAAILVGNLIGCACAGMVIRYASPQIATTAYDLVMKKIDANFFSILLKAIMCGVCMYLAVSIYKEKNNIIGILFFIPIFISCGWEHSIALVAYYALGGTFYILPLTAAVLGNAIGAKLIYEINEKAKSKI